jgi:hypothetical protein
MAERPLSQEWNACDLGKACGRQAQRGGYRSDPASDAAGAVA